MPLILVYGQLKAGCITYSIGNMTVNFSLYQRRWGVLFFLVFSSSSSFHFWWGKGSCIDNDDITHDMSVRMSRFSKFNEQILQ